MSDRPEIDENSQTKIEAALFRKLLGHLRKYPEVQNIDLMNLAYFCRNCFSKWYVSEAESHGIEVSYEQAREIIYGMSYSDYKAKYQNEASAEQLDQFTESQEKATE